MGMVKIMATVPRPQPRPPRLSGTPSQSRVRRTQRPGEDVRGPEREHGVEPSKPVGQPRDGEQGRK